MGNGDDEGGGGHPYTYNKVHVACKGQMEEATDHMDMDSSSENGVPVKTRVMEIASASDLDLVLQKLIREKYWVDYLDFHAHGYGGAFYVDELSTISYDTLSQFRRRSYDSLFRKDAIISFMSCDVAKVDLGNGEDGELFLAEMASTFLSKNGGSVIGRNKPWRYKHSLGLGLIPPWGPLSAKFKNDGVEIAAVIAPGANDPQLRGNFRLDKSRLSLEVGVLKQIATAAISVIQANYGSANRSYPSHPPTGNKLDDMAARYLEQQQVDAMLKKMAKDEKNIEIVNRMIKSLDLANNKLKGWGQLYKRLHDAATIIDDQVTTMVSLGIPLSDIAQATLSAIRSVPANP